jgi:aspartate/methionine/tyrosine aminotransferase
MITPGTSRLADRLAARRKASKLPAGTVRLDNGDPDFNTPEPIRNAHRAALDAGRVHYENPQGSPTLRAALARAKTGPNHTFDPDDVVVTHGASGALAAAVLATIDPGDQVLLPEPTYSRYADLVIAAGGRPVFVPTRPPDFHFDLDAIGAAARGVRLIVICNPCNPTGAVYTRAELQRVASIAEENQALLISDEAYDHIVYGPSQFVSMLDVEEAADRLIYVQSFSKTYAMTGWRVGYLAAKSSVASACARVHRTLNGPVNSAVQDAALAALAMAPEWTSHMLPEYEARRAMVLEYVRREQIQMAPPEGAFYAFVPHPATITSAQMSEVALSHGVSVQPGSEFGPSGEGFLRLAFSVSREDLSVGLERLAAAMRSADGRSAGRAVTSGAGGRAHGG